MWTVVAWPLVGQRSKQFSWETAKSSWEQRNWAKFENEAGARARYVYLGEGV